MPAAPATQPRPKIGMRLTRGGRASRLTRRASIEGGATPVTGTKMRGSTAAAGRPALAPGGEAGVVVDRQRQVAAADQRMAMQALEALGVEQAIRPAMPQAQKQRILIVVMGRERPPDGGDLQGGPSGRRAIGASVPRPREKATTAPAPASSASSPGQRGSGSGSSASLWTMCRGYRGTRSITP